MDFLDNIAAWTTVLRPILSAKFGQAAGPNSPL